MLRNGHAIILLALCLLLWGCGGSSGDSGGYDSPPPGPPPAWADVAVIIQADCAPCHNGSQEPAFTSGAVFKASPAAQKLRAGAMPPAPRTISQADRDKLLAYLGS